MALLLIIIASDGHILANIAIVSQLWLAIDLSSKGLPGQLPSYLTDRQSRSTNTLSRQAPRPSMLIAMALSISWPVNAVLVNWLPWSVLKISGLPWRAT